MTQVAANRYAALSLVRDGDGYILGSGHTRDFVAVPRIGGEVVQWLQAGHTVDECTRRAAAAAGEPVDVAGFLAGLATAGLLPPVDHESAGSPRPAEVATWARRAGRILFGRVGLTVQGGLALTAVVLMAMMAGLRPAYTDVIVSDVPLLSLFLVAILGTASSLVHEGAHVLAAAARDVPARVSISRRLVTIVYQTDLTRLWSVPRRARVVPLLAGLLSDAATLGLVLLVEAALWPTTGAPLLRALAFIKIAGIVFQLAIFMRTDIYALFVVATGCRNLWGTKGAVARRAIRRATADDLALLATVDRREIRWAKLYLLLYIPGVAWTAWYFAVLALPAVGKLIAMSAEAITSHGLLSPLGGSGALALALTVGSTAFIVWGVLRTIGQLITRISARP